MPLKIADKHVKTRIAYGKNALPLGERSEKELHEIAALALDKNGEVKDEFLASHFEELPTLEEIKEAKSASFKKKAPVATDKKVADVEKAAAEKGLQEKFSESDVPKGTAGAAAKKNS